MKKIILLLSLVVASATGMFAGSLADALDTSGLIWTTGGDAIWSYQTDDSHDGVDAARTGVLTNLYQTAYLETTVTGRVAVSFWWKVSSSPTMASFYFVTNNALCLYGYGEQEWDLRTVYFDAGTNHLRWAYTAVPDATNGHANAAWLDHVTVTDVTGLPPTILEQPQSLPTVPEDYYAYTHLVANVVGDPPLAYQWRRNGTNIDGGHPYYGDRQPALWIWNASTNQNGDYQLVVSNAWGMVTSAVASVTVVHSKPALNPDQNPDLEVAIGTDLWLEANPLGTRPFTFQWEKDNVVLSAETNSYLYVPQVILTDSGYYRFYVTNSVGEAMSRRQHVTVSTNSPVVLSGPNPNVQAGVPGEWKRIFLSASGPSPLYYAWLKDGVEIPDATGDSLYFDSLVISNSGLYQAIVSNPNGSVTSRVAILAVAPVDPLGVALDARDLTVTNEPSYYPWVAQTDGALALDGLACVQTPQIGDYEESVFATSVNGPGFLKYWWKISAATNAVLEIQIDGVMTGSISGEADWAVQFVQLSEGPHAVQWRFSKGESGAVGADAAWLDRLSLTNQPPQAITLNDALDNSSLVFSNGQNLWLPQTAISHDHFDAAVAQPLADQPALLTTEVQGPGTLRFWWKWNGAVDGTLGFRVNGIQTVSLNGPGDWTEVVQVLEAGTNQLVWEAGGEGVLAYLDGVGFAPTLPDLPVFVAEPTNRIVLIGQTVDLPFRAIGTSPITYTLVRNDQPWGVRESTDTNGVAFQITVEDATLTGIFQAVACNAAGCATSAPVQLTVCTPPVFVVEPMNAVLLMGEALDMPVQAIGVGPITYRLLRNSQPWATLESSDGSGVQFHIVAEDAGLTGEFQAVACNAAGCVTSAPVQISVCLPPVFSVEPTNTLALVGQPLGLSACAMGIGPITYSLWREGQLYSVQVDPGTNGVTFYLPTGSTNYSGRYQFTACNAAGCATSAPVEIQIRSIPGIVAAPQRQWVIKKRSLSLTVVAEGSEPLAYEWRKDGVRIPGANAPTYSLVQASYSDSGIYTVQVTNPYGTNTTGGVRIVVAPALFQLRNLGCFATNRAFGPSSQAYSVNNLGVVVGASDTDEREFTSTGLMPHAFIWIDSDYLPNGSMVDLGDHRQNGGTLAGTSAALDINDRNEVVGYYEHRMDPGVHGYPHAALWQINIAGGPLGSVSMSRRTWDIHPTNVQHNLPDSKAVSISQHGHIAVQTGLDYIYSHYGYLVAPDASHGKYTPFSVGNDWSDPRGINSSGVLVGNSRECFGCDTPVVYDGLGHFGLGVLITNFPAKTTAIGYRAINDRGVMVGYYATNNASGDPVSHQFLHYPNDTIVLLQGGDDITVSDINERNQMVGYAGANAMLFMDGRWWWLNDLIPNNTAKVWFANSINDRGWIAGQAYYTGVGTRACLLIPNGQGHNRSPVLADDLLEINRPQALRISAAILLANDLEPDDDVMRIYHVGNSNRMTEAGGSVRLSGDAILYTPSSSTLTTDTFAYDVTDGLEGYASARVTITFNAQSPDALKVINNPELRSDGTIRLSGHAPKQSTVMIYVTSDIGTPYWTRDVFFGVDDSGDWSVDRPAVVNGKRVFYRAEILEPQPF